MLLSNTSTDNLVKENSQNLVIKVDELENKKEEHISNILFYAFEYMLLKIVAIVYEEKKYKSIEDFNQNNTLSLIQCTGYPFFVSLSNGNSRSLFALFGAFSKINHYLVSYDIYKKLIGKNETEYFKFKNYRIQLKEEIVLNKDFQMLLAEIEMKEIKHFESKILFECVSILDDNGKQNKLINAINNGISILANATSKRFFIQDEETLIEGFKKFRAFREANNERSFTHIRYTDVEKEKNSDFYRRKSLILEF